MLIMFDSRTGNVRKFVSKLNMPSRQITESMWVDEPFVLITYTTGFGQIPDRVARFLKLNSVYLQGVAASGNRNWGERFARSADIISHLYNVPVLWKFELSGTMKDVDQFTQKADFLQKEASRLAVC